MVDSVKNDPLHPVHYSKDASQGENQQTTMQGGTIAWSDDQVVASTESKQTTHPTQTGVQHPEPASSAKAVEEDLEKIEQNLKDLRDLAGRHTTVSLEIQADLSNFMMHFLKLAQEMRSAERANRQSALAAQANVLRDASEQMLQAAKERRTAGMVEGSMQITGGAVQAGSSFAQTAKATKSMNKANEAANISVDPATGNGAAERQALEQEAKTAQIAATRFEGIGRGTSQAAGGVGTLAASASRHEADKDDAERAKLDAMSKTHEASIQQSYEMMQQMQDIIRDLREKYSSINQTALDANRSITRNFA